MRVRGIAVLAIVVILAGVGIVVAAGREREHQAIPMKGAEKVILDFEFGLGKLFITPVDIVDFASVDMYRDPSCVEEVFDFTPRGSTLDVSMESHPRSKWRHHNSGKNQWDMKWSTRYSTDARMDMGACEIDAELGGIPLTDLTLNAGAASGDISFAEPNPKRIKELAIEAGASSLNFINLGNARFDYMKFEGGVGSFNLDFRGKWDGSSEVSIEIGLGSADIILPEGLPMRLEADEDGWFSSVDVHRHSLERVEKGVYESEGYDNATTRMLIKIEVGMGSVDVRWKP